MLAPTVTAWVEEPDDFSARRVNRGKVRPFAPVALPAGQGKVYRSFLPAMLLCDDMVRFVPLERVVFVNAAIFAAAGGANSHSAPQRGGQPRDAHDLPAVARIFRASALSSIMR